MAFPDSTTLAPSYGFQLDNQALSVQAGTLPRKTALLAQYDPLKSTVVDNVPKLFLSKEQVGYELGWGFPAHRMAMSYSLYGLGVPMWVVPIPEAVGASKMTVDVTITVGTAFAGVIYLYIGDDLYQCPVSANDSESTIATNMAALINAETDAPVTASAALGVVTLTAKAGGTFGNGYLVDINYEQTQTLPSGVSVSVGIPSAGATDTAIDDALAGMGELTESNMEYFTDCVTSLGMDTTTLDACSTWNGVGNQPVGNYAPSVMRPTRFISVSTTNDTGGGYAAMAAIADARVYDRTNAIVGVPDHKRHPVEIASEMTGACASIAQSHPHQSYVGVPLTGHPGVSSERWTKDDVVRDTAIKAGISTSKVVGGVAVIDGMVTMYRPPEVAPQNNLYRSYRNVAITQNLSYFHRSIWESAKNKTIVEDTANVDSSEKPYVMDIDAAKDLNNQWADGCEGKAWIYNAAFTKETQEVVIRDLANGFDHTLKVIYSAEGVVSNSVVIADIALAALTA